MPEDRADKTRTSEAGTPQRPEDRLDSWKEIAAYLDRDVTTVQRWEKREGMPVRRHQHDRKGSVYAFRTELDEWAATRSALIANSHLAPPLAGDPVPSSAPTRARRFAVITASAAIVAALVTVWVWRSNGAWQNPLAGANFQPITEWDGTEMAAAISGDGRFVAFLSDRDGQMDVWITQPGSGHFYNLTKGQVGELVNPSIRTLGFSPDNSQVTFWVRKPGDGKTTDISIWAVPTLGGPARQYLDGAAEYAWAPDARRLAYHTPGPGDPLFVVDGIPQQKGAPIFIAPPGLHSHFPIWSPDGKFIYFVQGTLPDKLDIWRVASTGGAPERITFHNALVSHPVMLDRRTLLYLATDPDGSGPWIYGVDLAKKAPIRLASGVERYTSLSASADGRRLTATTATLTRTLWRVKRSGDALSAPARIPLTTATGFSPRLGPDYILFASLAGNSESLWRVPLREGAATELWRGHESRIAGGPAISPDGKHIAFSVRQQARTLLYTIDADGANVRLVTDALDLQGDPAWEPSGDAITIAAMDAGVPRLFRVPFGGDKPRRLSDEYGMNPAWAPGGAFAVHAGPDIGTTFALKAIAAAKTAYPLPAVSLTRGARRFVFQNGARSIVVLKGDIRHKDLWLIDLGSGAERRLMQLPADFEVRDFDISPDGREIVLERVQDRSDIALMELKSP